MADRVSIVIPTRDRPVMLNRAVSSALASARPHDEVIVVDDQSKNPALASIHLPYDHRMRIIQSAGRGAAAARNTGVANATSEVVLFLDDDDEMLPNYVRYVAEQVATKSPSPAFGYSAYYIRRERRGRPKRRLRVPLKTGYLDRNQPFERRSHGFGMGFWIRKDVFYELGPISDTIPTNEDTEYFLRLLQTDHIGWFAPEPGVVVHKHHGNFGELRHLTDRASTDRRREALRNISETHATLLAKQPSVQTYFTRKLIRLAAKSGDFSDGRNLAGEGGFRSWIYYWGCVIAYGIKARRGA